MAHYFVLPNVDVVTSLWDFGDVVANEWNDFFTQNPDSRARSVGDGLIKKVLSCSRKIFCFQHLLPLGLLSSNKAPHYFLTKDNVQQFGYADGKITIFIILSYLPPFDQIKLLLLTFFTVP